jgi:hypothetical protein
MIEVDVPEWIDITDWDAYSANGLRKNMSPKARIRSQSSSLTGIPCGPAWKTIQSLPCTKSDKSNILQGLNDAV